MKTLCLTCSRLRITSKSVILLILWNVLMFVQISLILNVDKAVYLNSNFEHYQSQYIVYIIGLCLICLSFPLFGLIADVKTIVEKGEYNNYFFITGLHTYFECKDNIVLEPSENSTKNSHHSSMRQQYMYMIYLYQGIYFRLHGL